MEGTTTYEQRYADMKFDDQLLAAKDVIGGLPQHQRGDIAALFTSVVERAKSNPGAFAQLDTTPIDALKRWSGEVVGS